MYKTCIHWAGVLCAFALTTTPLLAQDPPGPYPTPMPFPKRPYAIVTYPSADPNLPSVSVVSPCVDGVFALVGLVPDQVVQITVQYPRDEALQTIGLEALDGGMIFPNTEVTLPNGLVPLTVFNVLDQIFAKVDDVVQVVPLLLGSITGDPGPGMPHTPKASTLPIATNGTVTFIFVAGHEPGKYQVSLRRGSEELGIQLWAFDAQNPGSNPPAITPYNPYPAAND